MVETSHPQQDCKLNPLGHTDQIFRVRYNILIQEISNGRTHWTDPEKKPEYLIAPSQLTYYGSVGIRSHSIFDGIDTGVSKN